MFITTATVVYSLGRALHTLTAVPISRLGLSTGTLLGIWSGSTISAPCQFAIRAVATVWEPGEILFIFCQVSNARFHRFHTQLYFTTNVVAKTYIPVIVYQMHLIDYLITYVSVRVCLSTDRLSNDYVRNSLPIFTKFCTPLRNLVVSNAIVSGTNRK